MKLKYLDESQESIYPNTFNVHFHNLKTDVKLCLIRVMNDTVPAAEKQVIKVYWYINIRCSHHNGGTSAHWGLLTPYGDIYQG